MNELASRLRAQPEGDLTLAVGGVALAIAAGLAYARMHHTWADFPLFLLTALPCAVLVLLALAPGAGGNPVGTRSDGRLAAWQTACLLAAIPLITLSILLLIKVLGKAHPGTGTATWVLVLTGVAAAVISVRFDSPGATVLAAVAFAAAALFAVDWADSSAKLASYRDIALLEGLTFLLLARGLWVPRHEHAKQLAATGALALIGGASLGNGSPAIPFFFFDIGEGFKAKDGWTLILIAVVIGIAAFAAWQRHGGSAFVGILGLFSFFFFTMNGGDLSGWPLILAIVTLLCLVWALVVRPSRQQPGAGAMPHAPQPPTG